MFVEDLTDVNNITICADNIVYQLNLFKVSLIIGGTIEC